jgi:hypothetical protein
VYQNEGNTSAKQRETNSDTRQTNTRTQTETTINRVERTDKTNMNEDTRTTRRPETSVRSIETSVRSSDRKVYTAPVTEYYSPRVYRSQHASSHYYRRPPENKEYRMMHRIYRPPINVNVFWTPIIHTRFIEIYPMVKEWYYPVGYRIETISAYDAEYYQGEVMNVYGEISDVFYSRETDEYFLYFGPYYPYQDFTIVIPGGIARSYSSRPSRFFLKQNVFATGLITSFEGNPEIVIRDPNQFNVY